MSRGGCGVGRGWNREEIARKLLREREAKEKGKGTAVGSPEGSFGVAGASEFAEEGGIRVERRRLVAKRGAAVVSREAEEEKPESWSGGVIRRQRRRCVQFVGGRRADRRRKKKGEVSCERKKKCRMRRWNREGEEEGSLLLRQNQR